MTREDKVRTDQLRALVRELQSRPASRQRDALLMEAGKRLVAVETGVTWGSRAFAGSPPFSHGRAQIRRAFS